MVVRLVNVRGLDAIPKNSALLDVVKLPRRLITGPTMRPVRRLSEKFLQGWTGLIAVDLTNLSNVTKLGGYFLCGCSGLQSLDLSPLSNVTNLGGLFLNGCSGLQSLDVSPLSNVTNLGGNLVCFSGCIGLREVVAPPVLFDECTRALGAKRVVRRK